MGKLANMFRDRLEDSFERIGTGINKLGKRLRQPAKSTPRGKSTSHIKHNRESYRTGGEFKNRH